MTEDTVSSTSDEPAHALRALSRLLFGGASYRASVGAAIVDADMVANTAEIAEELGISRQSVNKEIQYLERAGLVVRRGVEGRKVYWVAEQSSYWALCKELEQNAGAMLARNSVF